MELLAQLGSNFSALSLKDLLTARNQFHYQLMSKNNVVATAIGLYRIRKSDPWPSGGHTKPPSTVSKEERTLINSEVRPYSWPCVYVFVSEWKSEESFSKNPWLAVPKTIFMEDGRPVPVCLIKAPKQDADTDAPIHEERLIPRNFYGPGTPLVNSDAQGMPRLSTAGCIVKDGQRFYALTNNHALGEPGTVIKAIKNSRETPVGITSSKGLTRQPFREVYPQLPSLNQYVQMDIGLVDVTNILDWKTNITPYGIVEKVLDLYDTNFPLQLISQKVRGTGAYSGLLRGEIHGLFYRYKSMGGYEYLSDFLIGPETTEKTNEIESFRVHHGDSGTMLMIELDKKFYPFALLWGKQQFIDDEGKKVQPFALATSLSTVLNMLELDFVRDINLDNDVTWGYLGHYIIGSKLPFALSLLQSPNLKAFATKNISAFAMEEDDIRNNAASPRELVKANDGTFNANKEMASFVPLADVPDNVWKSNVNFVNAVAADGSKSRITGVGSRGQADNPNHFADIDYPNADNKTLLDLTLSNPDANFTPSFWVSFYKSVSSSYKKWNDLYSPDGKFFVKKHWGALPFRTWQIFEAMADYASQGQQENFLCAAGILIHYVGDACQPLHSSYLSQGDPEKPLKKTLQKGKNAGQEINVMTADGVHSGYEDDMVESIREFILDNIEAEIDRQERSHELVDVISPIVTGYDAGLGIVKLISQTRDILPPVEIIDTWIAAVGLSKKERTEKMASAFSDKTVNVMARGTRYLAAIWKAAWQSGNGDTNIGEGKVLEKNALKALYDDPTFLPSMPLDQYQLKKNGLQVL